jgi:hypothetical protein
MAAEVVTVALARLRLRGAGVALAAPVMAAVSI